MVSGKWVAIALTASLAVNIFLAGLFVGRQMGGPPHLLMRTMGPAPHEPWRPGDRGLPPFIERMAERLEPQDRRVLVSAVEKHQADIAARGVALRQARAKLREIVDADKFDRTAAEAALTDLRQRSLEFQQTLQTALLDAAEQLPAEARREMMNPPRKRQPEQGPPER